MMRIRIYIKHYNEKFYFRCVAYAMNRKKPDSIVKIAGVSYFPNNTNKGWPNKIYLPDASGLGVDNIPTEDFPHVAEQMIVNHLFDLGMKD